MSVLQWLMYILLPTQLTRVLGVSFTVVNVYFVLHTADAGPRCQFYSG